MIKESIKETVELPQGMEATIEGGTVRIKSGGKENCKVFKEKGISLKKAGNAIEVEVMPATKKMNAKLRTIVGHLDNMIEGLQKEYEYKLAIVFSHFPMNASVKGNAVEISNFMGGKKPRIAKVLPGVKVEVKGKEIFVRGHDKEAVGQTAANLENATRVVGKDRRVFQDGIFIVSKGKSR